MTQRGSTFIDMAIAWTIIATLGAVFFPNLVRSIAKSRMATCQSNLLNIGAAMRMYAADNHGHLPPRDNDVTALAPTYLPEVGVLMCPSVRARRPISYPPTTPPERRDDGTYIDGPPFREQLLEPITTRPDEAIVSAGTPFDYVYRGGLCDDDLPTLALMTDDMPERHNYGANALLLSGSVKWSKVDFAYGSRPGDEVYAMLKPLDDLRRMKSQLARGARSGGESQ